jgi:hypothetical protein
MENSVLTRTEKLVKLHKVRQLALVAMMTLNPNDGDPADLDEDLYGAWLEFQAALMGVQEAICKIAVKDMEED